MEVSTVQNSNLREIQSDFTPDVQLRYFVIWDRGMQKRNFAAGWKSEK